MRTPRKPPRQLPLELPPKDSRTRGDFLAAPSNALALASIEGWQDWPGAGMLLIGPEGAGKSHLARLWADLSGAALLGAADLAGLDPGVPPDRPLAVEDAALIAGDATGEEALFHLYNAMAAGPHKLLLTARQPVRDWGLTLPDLVSRLATLPVTAIAPPDEALLAAVLVKLFDDRQIPVSPRIIDYLVARMERSLAMAQRLVAEIDRHALSEKRPVGLGMAREALKALDNRGGADA
ncbi:MAG TPA: chromosomal replication initiator DnaA [Aliiroseovarius sp.]|nr:chromosomal replication initiator DnaA [Aliiroseovarius sp.]